MKLSNMKTNRKVTALVGKPYELPEGCYIVTPDSICAKDYKITLNGEDIKDVVAIVRLAK